MSKELIAVMRKRRELKVVVGAITFIARRPTDVEAVKLHRDGGDFSMIARDFVVGWEGVTENDVVGGGGTDVVPFDVGVWQEWCADSSELWPPIAKAVLEAYKLHAGIVEDAAKN